MIRHRFSARDVEALRHVSLGADERDLAAAGLYRSSVKARVSVDSMGRAMNGGTRLAWPGIVHLSVLHELVDTGPEHTRPTTVPPIWQLSLLYAWCEGQSLGQFAEEAELTRMEAAELSLLVCVRLNAVNARHAVRRGHETGLLTSPVRHRAIKLEEAPA